MLGANLKPEARVAVLKRIWPLLAVAALVAAVYASGYGRLLSLETLRDQREALRAFVDANTVLAFAIFVGVYALAVSASVPGAVFLTLAGGFLFGTWLGGTGTVIGATIGAIVIFYAVRTAIGRPLREKAEAGGGLLQKVVAGVREDAFAYVLTLRLTPVAPFWLVNVAAGVADAPLRAYAPATFLGIMPATFVYSAVGAGLDQVFARGEEPDLSLIFQPYVLGPLVGLALLSLVPVVIKRLNRRKGAQGAAS